MGYTATANVIGRFTSNADFQTWGSFISDAIGNTGLVQTADTGQIDWSTAAMPSAVSQAVGYEIWRFDDALQSSAPVYLKLEYGSAAASANAPGLRWTLATGTAGNGSVTGFPSMDQTALGGNTFTILQYGGVFANNTLYGHISGDTNRLAISLGTASAGNLQNPHAIIGWERTVDANGNPTGQGVLVSYLAGGNPVAGQVVWSPKLGRIMHDSSATNGWGILAPEKGGGTTGANTAVYPVFHTWGGGAFLNPGLNFFAYWNAEMTYNTPNTFTVYGASHTYIPLGNAAVWSTGFHPRGNNQLALMMRWE